MADTTENQQIPLRLEDTALRYKIRDYARQQRKDLRTNTMDALRFSLGQIKDEIRELENLGAKDVRGMASRIKRRKHADAEDMYRLCHAFLQDNDNISVFCGVQGAVQVIVKELTGPHVARQIEAAECLCNLSLGEPFVCEKITNLAGSYLVTYLNSQESRLKRSCLWTLANILASCKKSAKMLLQMQLATKLWKLYTAPETDVQDFQEDAGICLYLIAKSVPTEVTNEDRRYIAEHLDKKQPMDAGSHYYMYIIFKFDLIGLDSVLCEPHYQHLFNFFMTSVNLDYNKPNDKLRILFGVHVLSNIFATRPAQNTLQLDSIHFASALNKLFSFKNPSLTLELFQLISNLMNLQLVDNEQLLEQIRIYDCPIRA